MSLESQRAQACWRYINRWGFKACYQPVSLLCRRFLGVAFFGSNPPSPPSLRPPYISLNLSSLCKAGTFCLRNLYCIVTYVEGLYCKRPILCLPSSKILTPHPLTARRRGCTPPPPFWCGGRTHSPGGKSGRWSIFWKTPDTARSVLWIRKYFVVTYIWSFAQLHETPRTGSFLSKPDFVKEILVIPMSNSATDTSCQSVSWIIGRWFHSSQIPFKPVLKLLFTLQQ